MRKAKAEGKKLNKIDRYVIFSISCVLVYTVVSLVMAGFDRMVPDGLTTCFFAVFGGEILSCCLIKIFGLKEDAGDGMDRG